MQKQELKHTSLKSPAHLLFKMWIGAFLFLLLGFSTPLLSQDEDLDPCSTVRVDGILEGNPATAFHGIIVFNPVTDKQAIRIFDENWQQIDECTSSECGNPYRFATGSGRYFVQVQSFKEDATWLCQSDPIEVTVPAIITPCDAFCDQQALVEFKSQADIDAFCGCEVIKGDVRITGDVTSLQPLNGLKKVEGFLAIFSTELTDFSGLESLEVLDSDLYIANNLKLKKLKGLENIDAVKGALIIEGHPVLETLDGLNIKTAQSLSLGENDALINIEALKNITSLNFITITGNEKLPNLEGLNNLTNLGNGDTQGGGASSLVIGGNAGITTLSALSNLKTVDENLIVQFNASLTECCGIVHLIDDDPNNGQATSAIKIDNNLMGCNSVEDILANCGSTMPDCEAIALSINPNNASTIDIAGLTTPHYIVRVYDEDWNQILSCTDDCTSVGAYEAGLYRIHAQLYDENWQYICETDFLKITIGGVPEPVNCEDITTTISDLIIENGQARREVSVTFNSPEGQRTGINIFDRSPEGTNGGGLIFDCGICESPQEFTLEEGEYVIIVDRSYLDVTINPLGCGETFFIDVPAEPCTDNDGDYLCDYNECNDNDSEVVDLKFPAGTPCNDGDDTTNDDVIQEDGCTCMGTPISDNPCDNVQVALFENDPRSIVVEGLNTGNQIVKVYDPHWNVIRDCSTDCDLFGVFEEAGIYRVYAQLYDENWQYICETDFLKIEIPATESESRDGGDFLNEREIVLFPNPVLHTLNIQTKALQDKKGSIQIYNTFGQLVKEIPSKVFNQDYESIEVGNYENGLYIMTLKVENSPVISRRFLVENLK